MKEYLQLTRAHTVPLEAVPAALGAAIATGGFWNIHVLLWGMAGVLYHLTGYGQNSYTDWVKGYDKDDPNKQHHPLNSGSLTQYEARMTVEMLFIASIIYVLFLTSGQPIALGVLAVGVLAGIHYNRMGKESVHKPVSISIAHTTIFVLPYVSLGGSLGSELFIVSTAYVFFWVFFQIAVSGEIKDLLETDEHNILRDTFGVVFLSEHRTSTDVTGIRFMRLTKAFSYCTKSVGMAFAVLIAMATGGYVAVVGIFSIILIYMAMRIVRDGWYLRDDRLAEMSAIEAGTLITFVVALSPVIGIEAVVLLSVGSVAWVLAFNKIEWGTWLSPEV